VMLRLRCDRGLQGRTRLDRDDIPALPGQDSLDSHGVASLHRGQSYRATSGICQTRRSLLEFLSLGLRKNPEQRKITQPRRRFRIKRTLVVAEAPSGFANLK
jgi:hypothetical protein